MQNETDEAAAREDLPVEQSARDSFQQAINMLELARDSQTLFGVIDYTDSALKYIAQAFQLQCVKPVDLTGFSDAYRNTIAILLQEIQVGK